MVCLFNVYELQSNCHKLRSVNKMVICCKRTVVKKIVPKCIKKDSIIKQQSVLLDGTCLYLFVDKYIDSGTIEHYFYHVNRVYDMRKVKCTIKGTNNNLRKATLRRLLAYHCQYYVDSDMSSDGSTSS